MRSNIIIANLKDLWKWPAADGASTLLALNETGLAVRYPICVPTISSGASRANASGGKQRFFAYSLASGGQQHFFFHNNADLLRTKNMQWRYSTYKHSRGMVTVTRTNVDDLEDIPPAENDKPVSTDGLHKWDSISRAQDEFLTITPSCVKRIRQLAQRRGGGDAEGIYLRVFVNAGGCSGFQYKFELEHDNDGEIDEEDDFIFHPSSDTRVVIDRESLDLLRGSTIDFVEEMIKSSFAVTSNPQSEKACGCGSSFAIKKFSSNPALD